MTKQHSEVSVEQLKSALETFDWAKVLPLLSAGGGPTTEPELVAEAIRRAGRLLLKYPVAAETKRDQLLASLSEYLATASDGCLPSVVQEALATLRVAEAGYRRLLDELSQAEASNLDPSVHVAAAIARAEGELSHLRTEFRKQSAQREAFTTNVSVLDDSGNLIDMDGALERCIDFVSMTLQMEAFKGKWFDANENIIVPTLPEVTEQQVFQAGTTFFLAVIWQRWQMTEEKARAMGRRLRFLQNHEFSFGESPDVKAAVVDEGDATSDWLHRVALERTMDKFSQNLIEIQGSVGFNRRRPASTSAGQSKLLPPYDWISDEEVHAVWGLEQYLAYEVVPDQERHGDLRLVEWVRGYSALVQLARGVQVGSDCRTKTGWVHFFSGFGLASATAEVLLDRLTFKRSSRDLFDHPFIKLADGRYKLFSPAMRAPSIPMVVLSALSHLNAQLGEKKGKGFETTVRGVFEGAGLKSYAFKEKRGEEEYEYDLIVPWGDYLFVIECKNRSLPFGSPLQMRYFDLGIQESIQQLHRLMRGLDDHPDILKKHLPPGEAGLKKRVPVLLNCFPYSAPGPVDGVYLYDYSALSRFFLSGEIMLKAFGPAQKEVEEFGTGRKLWTGHIPSPEDFLAQLTRSFQFDAVVESLKSDRRGFPIPPDWWAFGKEFSRDEPKGLAEAWEKAARQEKLA